MTSHTTLTPALHIRRARPDESEVLTGISLRSKGLWGYDDAFMAAVREAMTIDAAIFESDDVFVIECDGNLAGFFSLTKERPIAYIDHFLVDRPVVRRGIGRAVWPDLESIARRLGIKSLRVNSDPHARGFYEAMGMRHVADVPSEVFGSSRLLPVLEKHLDAG
ncbi:MAG: GNAT family N-acetyltransferase [Dongiaceae bacterium]